jgi:hypothetical protein
LGASNFARGNTSKVFAVLMDIEETFKECSECGEKHYDFEYNTEHFETLSECNNSCEETTLELKTEYRSCEDFEYDDLTYYLRETAEEKAKQTAFRYNDESGSDNDRNYCATDLFSLYTSKSYGDIEVEIKITGQIVSAYYEGASLDYRLEIYNGGEWSEVSNGYYKVSVSDIVDGLFESEYDNHTFSDMNRGLRTILAPKATKWAEKETEKMIEAIEEIFTQVSIPLNVVASFSNGETIYSKAV